MTEIEKKYKLAEELLAHPRLKEFQSAGFINETAVRNCLIIREYLLLRKEYNHLDSLEKLTEKYHLSEDRILSILYKHTK